MKRYISKIRNRIKLLFGIDSKKYYQDYYYKVGGQNNDLNYYLSLFTLGYRNDFATSSIEICSSKSWKFGCSIEEVKKRFHRTNFHLFDNQPIGRVVILYYKTLIGRFKVRGQIHFHNNKLFLLTYCFPYVDKVEKDEIIGVIKNKYLAEKEEFDLKIIKDSFNNYIQMEDNFGLTISYLSLDCDLFKELSLQSKPIDEEEQKNNHTKEYNKLYDIL